MLFCVLSATSIFSLTWRSFSEEQLPFYYDKRQKKNRRTAKKTTKKENSAMVDHSRFASLLSIILQQIFSNKIEVCVIIPLVRPPREKEREKEEEKIVDKNRNSFQSILPRSKSIDYIQIVGYSRRMFLSISFRV